MSLVNGAPMIITPGGEFTCSRCGYPLQQRATTTNTATGRSYFEWWDCTSCGTMLSIPVSPA